MRRMADGKGRGWVATAPIPAGTILIVEPAILPTVPPQEGLDEEGTLPLLRAVAQALRRGGRTADAIREYLECLYPLEGEEDAVPMLRDRLAMPYVESIGREAGLDRALIRLVDLKIQRNQMDLKLRAAGELLEFGSGVFPFAALFNHSCHPHAQWRPLASGSAIVVSAVRDVSAAACDEIRNASSTCPAASDSRRQLDCPRHTRGVHAPTGECWRRDLCLLPAALHDRREARALTARDSWLCVPLRALRRTSRLAFARARTACPRPCVRHRSAHHRSRWTTFNSSREWGWWAEAAGDTSA